ncbi:MAG: carbon storage regulator [Firmicutes bacterium]|nr:carbon storage regulator [Bacillota bacterium]MDH7496666.1 carbon storage regulator [Bacillota bacterium]
MIIADDIKVTVISVDTKAGRAYVKLGITAPADLRIYREEIYEEIRRENEAASGATLTDFAALARAWRQMRVPARDRSE